MVTRIAHRTALLGLSFAALVSIGSLPAGASVAQDAQKICLERYNVEKAGNTIPAGMPKSKYMSQCTKSVVRNAQIEEDLANDAASQGAGGEGGPLITDPSKTPKLAKPTTTAKPATTKPATTAPSGN
jgi:hypothetical protein